MNKTIVIISIFFTLSCGYNSYDNKNVFLTASTPSDIPEEFMPHLIPSEKLIHKGVFSPDLNEYYYTLSDKEYKKFDVFVIQKSNKEWSAPKRAFFNSDYSDHGMSFSPDGNTIYFSSTRPTNKDSIPITWHIWKSEKINDQWSEPVFIDIPNLRHKLVSHPTISKNGTLYFHSSNLDYSDMDIYHSTSKNGAFQTAVKTNIETNKMYDNKCTPYVSPNEEYMLFATIGEQLDLMISFNDGQGNWKNTKKLADKINTFGQGNPYVTPDNKFLFYTAGKSNGEDWKIKWVNVEEEIK